MLSVGQSIDLYKDVGAPADIAERYRFESLNGTHLVGHTRMATESAVTPAHAHPFTAGRDFCLVHNGSLSNPHLVRKRLEPLGIEFETDNDTEAACRFFEWRLREGDDLEDGGAARLQRARRVLHLPDGHGQRAAHRARRLRLQAGGRRRDRRIRRDRLGVPLVGASAAHLSRRAVRAQAGGDLSMANLRPVPAGREFDLAREYRARFESVPAQARGARRACRRFAVKNPDGAHSMACGLDARSRRADSRPRGLLRGGNEQARLGHRARQCGPGRRREHDVRPRAREGVRLYGRRRLRARRAAGHRRRCIAALRDFAQGRRTSSSAAASAAFPHSWRRRAAW